jgi:DNA-binding response OmpR family regulator
MPASYLETMRLLVIEDYEPVRQALVQGLSEAGFAVDATGDGEEGLWFAKTGEYDVVLLDLMLPGVDGLTILRRLRERSDLAHVLILSAKDTLDDRLEGLNLGADDYLVKPFALKEVIARVRSLVRRKYGTKSPVFQIGDLEIDTGSQTVQREGQAIVLTSREYAILEFLAHCQGEVVTRTRIWEHVYDFHAEPNSNVIDVHVGQLRKKLEVEGRSRLIQTRRGAGYVLQESD